MKCSEIRLRQVKLQLRADFSPQAHNKLVELLDAAGIEREMESFSSDPKPALTNLKVQQSPTHLSTADFHALGLQIYEKGTVHNAER